MHELLARYPKQRPPLSAAHEKIYVGEYIGNRAGEGIANRLSRCTESWMHKQVARHRDYPVLEVGAGNLNHLAFEKGHGRYDVIEPFTALLESSPHGREVTRRFERVDALPPDARYRRIISIAVLEHMTNLPYELAKLALLLDDNAAFIASIPSEGGLMWGLGWRCSTGLSYYLRNRLDYGVIMRHEHVNTAREIIALVRYLFADVKITRFPLPAHHLSLYTHIHAKYPRLELCRELIKA